jgi:hypothetical protein
MLLSKAVKVQTSSVLCQHSISILQRGSQSLHRLHRISFGQPGVLVTCCFTWAIVFVYVIYSRPSPQVSTNHDGLDSSIL